MHNTKHIVYSNNVKQIVMCLKVEEHKYWELNSAPISLPTQRLCLSLNERQTVLLRENQNAWWECLAVSYNRWHNQLRLTHRKKS
jgi:hypothetical protein